MFEKLKQILHIHFHSWGKWEEYQVEGERHIITGDLQGKAFKIYQTWQKRTCKECGLVKRRKVAEHC